jgi:hypothetical protein
METKKVLKKIGNLGKGNLPCEEGGGKREDVRKHGHVW